MGTPAEPIAPPGPPLTPLQVLRGMTWLGELDPREIVDAVQAAADAPDLAARWPELTADEIADMRRQCRAMTKNRLRTWQRLGERQPTWLEIRGLISGLHRILA